MRSIKRTFLLTCAAPERDIQAMATTALLPRTAPFGDDEIASLDRVLSVATPLQRAWLAGFLAGRRRRARSRRAAQPQARPAEPLTILFASESGNAERLAQDAAKLARKSGFTPKLVDFADLARQRPGRGRPPDRRRRDLGRRRASRAGGTRLCRADGRRRRRGSTASPSACWRSATPPMRSSAPSARRSTRGSPSSAPSAALDRVDCDLDFEAPAASLDQERHRTRSRRDESRAGNVVVGRFRERAPRSRSAASRCSPRSSSTST